MRYVRTACSSGAYIPKLLGIYERELAAIVDEICVGRPSIIVNVGAGEGYYAVGLARRLRETPVIAFEMDPVARQILVEMAKLNGVHERLTIRGKCEANDFAEIALTYPDATCIIDVEGYEENLLQSSIVHMLSRASILVELHEFIHPGITERLARSFAHSHTVDLVWQQPRDRGEFPWRTFYTALLPGRYLDWAVSEWRPIKMSWLWLKPRQAAG
jgi:ribosomal protein L11 methylase PrmA